MPSLMDLIGGAVGGNNISQISREIGADEKTTQSAVNAALPTLLAALAKNAASQQGADALLGAIKRDHDGSVLNDVVGTVRNAQQGPGDGILRHVLGNRRSVVERSLGTATGLSQGSTDKLMKSLAPLVMGAVGKQQREQGMDASALAGFLGQQRQQIEKESPKQAGLLGKLLDTDGDGDVDIKDMMKHGMKMFTK